MQYLSVLPKTSWKILNASWNTCRFIFVFFCCVFFLVFSGSFAAFFILFSHMPLFSFCSFCGVAVFNFSCAFAAFFTLFSPVQRYFISLLPVRTYVVFPIPFWCARWIWPQCELSFLRSFFAPNIRHFISEYITPPPPRIYPYIPLRLQYNM